MLNILCNCNCNWCTCIAPPTRRPRVHHRVNPYPGARRQNETEMFSDHDKTSPSITAVSAPSVACSMLAVQQQKRLCRQFIDVTYWYTILVFKSNPSQIRLDIPAWVDEISNGKKWVLAMRKNQSITVGHGLGLLIHWHNQIKTLTD